jgi:type IV secretion system protein VirB8
MRDERLEEYYQEAESWSHDRQQAAQRSVRVAWIVAAAAVLIALLLAIALALLIPTRRDVPHVLLVDRQTGYVQRLNPLETETIAADAALTRSFLAQYVIARESYHPSSLQEDYRKVGLWSAEQAREQYVSLMRSENPANPIASLPRGATIDVEIRSVSALSDDTAMVRFSTARTDLGGREQVAQHWAAIVTFRYSAADMTAQDRLTNPLGFQVTRYRRDAETLPEVVAPTLPTTDPIPSTVDPAPAEATAP